MKKNNNKVGRPKGSKSYVAITIKELEQLGLTEIPISKAFLKKNNVDASSFDEFTVAVKNKAEEEIEMTITE